MKLPDHDYLTMVLPATSLKMEFKYSSVLECHRKAERTLHFTKIALGYRGTVRVYSIFPLPNS